MTTKRIEFIPKPFFHENFYDIKNLYPTPQILHETQTLSPYLESTTFSNYNSTSSTLNSTASSNSSEILETAKNFNANLVLPWPSEVLGLVKNSTTASSLMTCSKKIVLIGDQAVGKTTLLKKYSKNVIDLNYKATIGIDFECLKYNILNVPFTIQVWDTAGQERFRAMSSQYYRKAQLVMITADASNTESIDNILMWDQHLKNNVDEYEKLLKIVVLTKGQGFLEGVKFGLKNGVRKNAYQFYENFCYYYIFSGIKFKIL